MFFNNETFISESKLNHLKSANESNQASLTPSPIAQAKPTTEKAQPDLPVAKKLNSKENHRTKEESAPPSPRQQIDLNESIVQHSADEFGAANPGKMLTVLISL